MSADRLLLQRMTLGGGILAAYGVWISLVRLPRGAGFVTTAANAALAVLLFAAIGIVVFGAAVALAMVISRPFPRRGRAAAGAIVETVPLVLLFTFIFANEIVFSATTEVFGIDAFLLLWHNTAAVFQNAWRMAPVRFLSLGIVPLAAFATFYALSLKSFCRLAASLSSTERPRPMRGRAWLAGSLAGPVLVLVAVLTFHYSVRRGEALTVLCRSSPPLRALKLPMVLSGVILRGPAPSQYGSQVISETEYKAAMGRPRDPAPNVVFILLESVSAKALHCYGYSRADVSPNIDAMAAEGTRFEHCLGTASFSVYGLTSIMTSLYMLRAERFDHFDDTSFPFMGFPRVLKLAGYELGLFSSGNESFDNIRLFYPTEDFDKYYSHDTSGIQHPDCMRMDDRFAVGEFEKWLAARKDPRPFYSGFYLQSTHFNYEVPEPWASHYQPTPPPYSNGDGILQIPADVLPKLKNQYDNAMRYSDHWVGRIRDSLQRAGALDNTIIVITGDHGEAFMEHGLARHGVHVWDEMIHIPLIVWVGPKVRASLPVPPPARVADSVSGIDIAPTIAGLVGVAPHPSWQGVNVIDPAYTGRDRPLFFMTQYTRWQEGVCLNGLKYFFDLTEATESLYDLRVDPGETVDLVGLRPRLVMALRQLLGGWHTHQLQYYSAANRPFTRYIGRFQPDAALLDRIRAAP